MKALKRKAMMKMKKVQKQTMSCAKIPWRKKRRCVVIRWII